MVILSTDTLPRGCTFDSYIVVDRYTIPGSLVESCLRYAAGGHPVGCYSIDGYRADGYTVGGSTADSGTPDGCIAGRYVVNRCTSTAALLLTVAISTVAPTPMVSLLTVFTVDGYTAAVDGYTNHGNGCILNGYNYRRLR